MIFNLNRKNEKTTSHAFEARKVQSAIVTLSLHLNWENKLRIRKKNICRAQQEDSRVGPTAAFPPGRIQVVLDY